MGQRILVYGRVLDSGGRAVPDALVEVWQANAGRPLPARRRQLARRRWTRTSTGSGRAVTDSLGRYEFMTIKPGAYPWGNHHNAWRPAHIHFSLFGRAFTQRLVTQMYFPDDPLFGQDPIYNAIPAAARPPGDQPVLTSSAPQDNWALAFEWDIVLRGTDQTPVRDRGRRRRGVSVNPLDVPTSPSPTSRVRAARHGFLTALRLGPRRAPRSARTWRSG